MSFPFSWRTILAGIPLRAVQRQGMAGVFGKSMEKNPRSIPEWEKHDVCIEQVGFIHLLLKRETTAVSQELSTYCGSTTYCEPMLRDCLVRGA
jgi:hypothetical protein